MVALVSVSPAGKTEGFTAEGLVYRDGVPVVALNVHRREVEIAGRARGDEEFEFFVEAAANVSHPWGHANQLALPDYGGQPLFHLEQAELAIFDPEAWEFFHDYRVVLEAMETLSTNPRRQAELREALNASLNILDEGDRSTLRAARQALAGVLAERNGPAAHTVTAVGHAHIDTAWLWPLRETIRKCARTFATALDYIERYPGYVFLCSQPQQYAWMKAYYPEIWEGIRKAVRRGRWEPSGSMWVEPDCNLASGEALVRQLLHGKRFFLEEFGIETRDVWLPDVFGYSGALPQLLVKAGVPFFLRVGKRLPKAATEIAIHFKGAPPVLFKASGEPIDDNVLVIRIQPDEGIHLTFEAKVPDSALETRSVDMEFHFRDSFGDDALPDAYERLLVDALQGDASLFARSDEIELSWHIVDPILEAWDQGLAPLAFYEPGSWGPREADELLARDKLVWISG